MLTSPTTWATALLLAAVILTGCSASRPEREQPAIGTRDRPPPVPLDRVLVGAAVTPALPVDGPQASTYTRFDDTIGAQTQIAHLFRTWDVPLLPPDVDQILADGKYPLLSWNGSDIPGIAAGRHDDAIRAQAEEVAASGAPLLVRFRWEMDRPNLRAAVQSPATYVAAWRRVHDIFEEVGTPSVSWVWCPTAAGFEPGGDAAAFYPGDDVVDWVCADAYPDRSMASLEALLSPFLTWARAHDKPVMIGEFGVPRSASDDTRAAWLAEARDWLVTQHQIDAVVYFDLDVNPAAPVLQFAVDPGSAAAQALGELARALASDAPS